MFKAPYVVLDNASDDSVATRVYHDPVEVVSAMLPSDVIPALDKLRAAAAAGYTLVGYISYEAGCIFSPRNVFTQDADVPLLWFGVFKSYEEIDPLAILPDAATAWAGRPEPLISRDEYDAAFARVLDLIKSGDIYQANLTFQASVPVMGDPLALYAGFRSVAGAGYGSIIDTGMMHILSLSPELFISMDGSALKCKPMKGTALRGAVPEEDRFYAAQLRSCPKQRAENLMIVDLMRNDLSRVAKAGSVSVPHIFDVETYPTIHQMTSTITATLSEGLDAIDVIKSMFPCGSITGAPKQRSMEVIAEVERVPRGVYTGAIGRIGGSSTMLNVAIRTLVLKYGETRATIGLGSGIVADSDVDQEWEECLAKAAFLTAGRL